MVTPRPGEFQIALTIKVVGLPVGERFCVQHKKGLLEPTECWENGNSFDFSVRVQIKDGVLNFLGDYVNGSVGDRFVYVNSGTMAGDGKSEYTRRAKIKLGGITEEQVAKCAEGRHRLTATFSGIGKDGGPACATVPLLDGWKISAR